MEGQYAPTEKRLRDARKEGQVLKSTLLSQAAVVGICVFTGSFAVSRSWVRIQSLLQYTFINSPAGVDGSKAAQLLEIWMAEFIFLIAPVLGAGVVAAVLCEALQVGFQIFPHLSLPKLERLSVIGGFKRIGSGIRDSWQLLLKLVISLAVLWWLLQPSVSSVVQAALLPEAEQFASLSAQVKRLLVALVGTMVVLGALDYGLKRRKFYKDMSMKREDLVREHKENEGDPHIRSHRRALHEAILMQDMVARVRKSKVVVVEKNA